MLAKTGNIAVLSFKFIKKHERSSKKTVQKQTIIVDTVYWILLNLVVKEDNHYVTWKLSLNSDCLCS